MELDLLIRFFKKSYKIGNTVVIILAPYISGKIGDIRYVDKKQNISYIIIIYFLVYNLNNTFLSISFQLREIFRLLFLISRFCFSSVTSP